MEKMYECGRIMRYLLVVMFVFLTSCGEKPRQRQGWGQETRAPAGAEEIEEVEPHPDMTPFGGEVISEGYDGNPGNPSDSKYVFRVDTTRGVKVVSVDDSKRGEDDDVLPKESVRELIEVGDTVEFVRGFDPELNLYTVLAHRFNDYPSDKIFIRVISNR